MVPMGFSISSSSSGGKDTRGHTREAKVAVYLEELITGRPRSPLPATAGALIALAANVSSINVFVFYQERTTSSAG